MSKRKKKPCACTFDVVSLLKQVDQYIYHHVYFISHTTFYSHTEAFKITRKETTASGWSFT